jgi:hypothetical protein
VYVVFTIQQREKRKHTSTFTDYEKAIYCGKIWNKSISYEELFAQENIYVF